MIAQGKEVSAEDFPWQPSTKAPMTKRAWPRFGEATGSLAGFDAQQLRAALFAQQALFLATMAAGLAEAVIDDCNTRWAYAGGVTPWLRAQASRCAGVVQQQLVQH